MTSNKYKYKDFWLYKNFFHVKLNLNRTTPNNLVLYMFVSLFVFFDSNLILFVFYHIYFDNDPLSTVKRRFPRYLEVLYVLIDLERDCLLRSLFSE